MRDEAVVRLECAEAREPGIDGPKFVAGPGEFMNSDIPGDVDLAMLTTPARLVPDLIDECGKKKIPFVTVITSDFSETGPEGAALEREVVDRGRRYGLRVVGPNTMGICNPHHRLYATGAHVRPAAGSTALVSQSGNMGTQFLAFAEHQGIGIRGFCGSGNEAMTTIEDLLESAG